MAKLEMYVGTFSNEKLIKRLKEDNGSLIYEYNRLLQRKIMSDETIIKEVIEKGLVKDCFTMFFAENIAKAKATAKQMGLKDFSPLGKVYEIGVDF